MKRIRLMATDPDLPADVAAQIAHADKLLAAAAKFLCPHCGHDKSRVTGGLHLKGRQRYRRYRRCLACDGRYNTTEGNVRPSQNKKSISCKSPAADPSL